MEVFQATRISDGLSVVIKSLKPNKGNDDAWAKFNHEYSTLAELDLNSTVKVIEKIDNGIDTSIVFRDMGGVSLEKLYCESPFDLRKSIKICIEIASALRELHQADVIHKNISPNNVIYDDASGQLRLIDFSLATKLSREEITHSDPEMMAAELHYVSPEQTGRINRRVDFRTDFYSFGATMYRLLAGHPPFQGGDALEQVHSHIAVVPRHLTDVDEKIPKSLSDIVARLLAKNPEDRYQSATGIQADLVQCEKTLTEDGEIPVFEIGKRDMPSKFTVPEKLVGRDSEISSLLSSFDTVCKGHKELVLVSGVGGIGKTSIVREIYRPITAKNGYFTSGKFEKFKNDIPYSVIERAFQELVRQLLSESEYKLALWKKSLEEVLAGEGQVIVEVIPELQHIIGPQQPVEEVSDSIAKHRFNRVFVNFIKVFCTREHPLVIFLDDLQWVDPGTLTIIDIVMKDDTIGHLMLIGSYRDDEVDAMHGLTKLKENLRTNGIEEKAILLKELTLEQVNEFVAITLLCDPKTAEPLARLIKEKTAGNPFFVAEFLDNLHKELLIKPVPLKRTWAWDLDAINEKNITDNVVELMVEKIRKLSEKTQYLLKVAACIGTRFDYATLALVAEKNNFHEVMACLTEASDGGVVIPIGEAYKMVLFSGSNISDLQKVEYKFCHDRIHAAAYSMVDDESRKRIHRNVGQLLYQKHKDKNVEEHIFEIINQLNLGKDLISVQSERDEIASLNLMAAQRARNTTAYEAAANYVLTAVDLLGDEAFSRSYDFAIDVYVKAQEACYLAAKYEKLTELAEFAEPLTRNVIDRVRIKEWVLASCYPKYQLEQALDYAQELLTVLGYSMPAFPTRLQLKWLIFKVKRMYRRKDISALAGLPDMTNEKALAAMKILTSMATTAFMVRPMCHAYATMLRLFLTLKFGIAPESAHAFASFGLLNCAGDIIKYDYDLGFQFGELSVRVAKRCQNQKYRLRTEYTNYAFVHHWREHARTALPGLHGAHKTLFEIGDFEYGVMSGFTYLFYAAFAGEPLGDLVSESEGFSETCDKYYSSEMMKALVGIHLEWVEKYTGDREYDSRLGGHHYSDEAIQSKQGKDAYAQFLFLWHFVSLVQNIQFGNYDHARPNADLTRLYVRFPRASMFIPLSYYYDSLAILMPYRYCEKVPKNEMSRILDNQSKLRVWADHAPENFLQKWYLVEAEVCRVKGDLANAQKHYEAAIKSAKSAKCLPDQALSNEYAAKLYLQADMGKLVSVYLEEAVACYLQWEAHALANRLINAYPEYLSKYSAKREKSKSTNGAKDGVASMSIAKAIKTISESESPIDKIEKMLSHTMEAAGAQKAILILQESGSELIVKAVYDVESLDLGVVHVDITLRDYESISKNIVHYVFRTTETAVIHNAQQRHANFRTLHDEYLKDNGVLSVLCIPLATGAADQKELIGMLYLENNSVTHAFSEEIVDTLELISSQFAKVLQLDLQATYDKLTKLVQRGPFLAKIESEVVRAERYNTNVSVVMIDIDHFKRFNDTYGHSIGDLVLKETAKAIQNQVRKTDVVARLGGEEMIVLCPETQLDGAVCLAEKIRLAVEENVLESDTGEALNVRISLGVCEYISGMRGVDDLMEKVDAALYHSKENGRNRTTAYKDNMKMP